MEKSNPRVCVKRIDPDLPFYYSMSAHGCFYIVEMPDFNSKSSPTRLPRYELLGANNRVTFAVHHSFYPCQIP